MSNYSGAAVVPASRNIETCSQNCKRLVYLAEHRKGLSIPDAWPAIRRSVTLQLGG